MPSAARTAAACRIAQLDRQKFNDLMASGEYECAPKTKPGVARVFEIPDLIALVLFTQLTEKGRTIRQASEIACRIRTTVESFPDTSHVAIAYTINGPSFSCRIEDANPTAGFSGSKPVLWTELWNVANLRETVLRGLEEEARIVGGGEEISEARERYLSGEITRDEFMAVVENGGE